MSSVVPTGWSIEKIEDLTKDKKGAIKIGPFGSALSKKEMVSKGIKVFGQENVYRKNFSIGSYYITDEKYASLKSCTLEQGDVVVSMMGTVGASAIFPEGAEIGVMDSHLLRIQVNPQTITSEFLRRQISDYEWVSRQIERMSQGGIMSGLNAAIVKSVKVVIPPLPEQKKIASILTSVDEVIENTQKQIDKLQNLKKATMNELLTKGIGHTEFKDSELGRIPKSWQIIQLGKVTKRFYQGINTVADKLVYHSTGIPILQTKHITSGEINFSSIKYLDESTYLRYKDKFQPQKNDILLSNIGTIGKSVLVKKPSKYLIAWNIFLISVTSQLEPRFAHMYLQKLDLENYYENLMTGNATKFVNKTNLSNILLTLPSITEQVEISNVMDSIVKKIELREKKLHQTQSLKKSLMQDLLTGKVRVTVN